MLAAAHDVQVALPAAPPPAQADAIADIRAQLDRLLPHGFVTATGAGRLTDLARYLTAIGRRLERLPQAVGADRERMQRVHAVQTPTTTSSARCHRPARPPTTSAISRG